MYKFPVLVAEQRNLQGHFSVLFFLPTRVGEEGPNVSTTPITAMGCRKCLPLIVVQLKGLHCRKSHCRNGVLDTLGQDVLNFNMISEQNLNDLFLTLCRVHPFLCRF